MKYSLSYEEYMSIPPGRIVVFDTETTGFSEKNDDLLQFSAIDGNGSTLLNTYLRPEKKQSWPGAMRVNQITPQMVRYAPTLREMTETVRDLFDRAELIVAFNNEFDGRFVREKFGVEIFDTRNFDVMKEWAEAHQAKWPKLDAAALYYRYDWGSDRAHDSLSDTRATLWGFRKMMEESMEDSLLNEQGTLWAFME